MKQQELFDESDNVVPDNTSLFYVSGENQVPNDTPPPELAKLMDLSMDAFSAVLHARMSELPIEREISQYIEKICKAGNKTAAAQAALDRGDPNVLAVWKAANKVTGEIHLLMGLLRFSPGPNGVYTARCAPDHFILPAMAEHFTLRFGETPWAIIDEKRGLCLYREIGSEATLIRISADLPPPTSLLLGSEDNADDSWEDLWRLYHRSIFNEGRKNLKLQRQFMPERYHKYLPELK